MAIFSRSNSLPDSISNVVKDLDEIKSKQYIGKGSLFVYGDLATLAGQYITGGSTAIFRLTYTFDNESDSLVLPETYTFGVTGSFSENFYSNPSNVASLSARVWDYTITPVSTLGSVTIVFGAKSTTSGSVSIARLA